MSGWRQLSDVTGATRKAWLSRVRLVGLANPDWRLVWLLVKKFDLISALDPFSKGTSLSRKIAKNRGSRSTDGIAT